MDLGVLEALEESGKADTRQPHLMDSSTANRLRNRDAAPTFACGPSRRSESGQGSLAQPSFGSIQKTPFQRLPLKVMRLAFSMALTRVTMSAMFGPQARHFPPVS